MKKHYTNRVLKSMLIPSFDCDIKCFRKALRILKYTKINVKDFSLALIDFAIGTGRLPQQMDICGFVYYYILCEIEDAFIPFMIMDKMSETKEFESLLDWLKNLEVNYDCEYSFYTTNMYTTLSHYYGLLKLFVKKHKDIINKDKKLKWFLLQVKKDIENLMKRNTHF
jgi:hypothetical protein